MTYAPIQGKCPVCHQDSANTSFQAGAASREAEVDRLREINSKLCEKSNWYVVHTARLEEERDQLRTQINTLRTVLEKACIRIEEYGFEIGEHWKIGREALNATKDQP